MVRPTRLRQNNSEPIYHYCSPETFLAICSKKTVRFADIFTMNDALELAWGYKVLADLATELGASDGRWVDLSHRAHGWRDAFFPLAACFSKDGDILSQWRAYAADGGGFSIGSTKDFIDHLPVTPIEVQYSLERQKHEITEFGRRVLELDPNGQAYDEALLALQYDLVAYKNPAFQEEVEVRLIHTAYRDPATGVVEPVGGTVGGVPIARQEFGFRMKGSVPSPFLDLSFAGADDALAEVVLGPKNNATELQIFEFLRTVGFKNVDVRRSKASYR